MSPPEHRHRERGDAAFGRPEAETARIAGNVGGHTFEPDILPALAARL